LVLFFGLPFSLSSRVFHYSNGELVFTIFGYILLYIFRFFIFELLFIFFV